MGSSLVASGRACTRPHNSAGTPSCRLLDLHQALFRQVLLTNLATWPCPAVQISHCDTSCFFMASCSNVFHTYRNDLHTSHYGTISSKQNNGGKQGELRMSSYIGSVIKKALLWTEKRQREQETRADTGVGQFEFLDRSESESMAHGLEETCLPPLTRDEWFVFLDASGRDSCIKHFLCPCKDTETLKAAMIAHK